MVAAIEARDPYTSGHSQRVAKASEIIAALYRTLGAVKLSESTVAALLHDVGKIDEQFAPILAKEGRLTSEEWEIMNAIPFGAPSLVGLVVESSRYRASRSASSRELGRHGLSGRPRR